MCQRTRAHETNREKVSYLLNFLKIISFVLIVKVQTRLRVQDARQNPRLYTPAVLCLYQLCPLPTSSWTNNLQASCPSLRKPYTIVIASVIKISCKMISQYRLNNSFKSETRCHELNFVQHCKASKHVVLHLIHSFTKRKSIGMINYLSLCSDCML